MAPGRARPPIVLVHGAANSAAVWIHWQTALSDLGWTSYAVDLRGHGAGPAADLSATSMTEYADDVRAFVRDLRRPPVLVGWSMGGLVALMVAAEYGIVSRDPDRQPTMPDLDHEERRAALASLGLESRLARDERAAGIVIERTPCPLLVVTGGEDRAWPRSRYAAMALPRRGR